MAEFQYPLVNGFRQDWSSIETTFDGGIQLGIRAINYKHGREGALVYGAGFQPLGETQGPYKPEASMEMLLAEFQAMVKKKGKGYAAQRFDITVAFRPAPGDQISVDKILSCSMKMIDKSFSQSPDGLVVKIDLQPLLILDNNTTMLPKMLGTSG